jgi:hypothetical protein
VRSRRADWKGRLRIAQTPWGQDALFVAWRAQVSMALQDPTLRAQ